MDIPVLPLASFLVGGVYAWGGWEHGGWFTWPSWLLWAFRVPLTNFSMLSSELQPSCMMLNAWVKFEDKLKVPWKKFPLHRFGPKSQGGAHNSFCSTQMTFPTFSINADLIGLWGLKTKSLEGVQELELSDIVRFLWPEVICIWGWEMQFEGVKQWYKVFTTVLGVPWGKVCKLWGLFRKPCKLPGGKYIIVKQRRRG